MLRRIRNQLRPYWPGNLQATLRSHKESQFAHVHVFSTDPAIVYLSWGEGRDALHREMKDRPLTLLYLFACWWQPEEIPPIAEEVRRILKRYPRHRVVMLCNAEIQVEWFRAQAVEAIFCNHNAWINENVFTIDHHVVKKYDAIYNATMARYKRHELAARVKSLALITYRYSFTHDTGYEEEIRKSLAHAAWLVDAHKDSEKATPAQVAQIYHQCRTGLCLSATEGAMFASIEYLLCGLPVVTTQNVGGRDVFFEPDYVEWVDDDADAVARGVQTLIARAPSPERIRARALAKMWEHRERLRDFLKDVMPPFEAPWPPGSHGALTARNLRELGRELRGA